jgi:hypothetical protein
LSAERVIARTLKPRCFCVVCAKVVSWWQRRREWRAHKNKHKAQQQAHLEQLGRDELADAAGRAGDEHRRAGLLCGFFLWVCVFCERRRRSLA